MTDILFYFFAVLAIVCALLVVFSRNAVNAAMFLIVTFLSMAALFVLLGAYFLAVLQVLVYAGAVVVLFLFIVMLLDVKGGKRHSFRPVTAVASGLALALMVGATVLFSSPKNLSLRERTHFDQSMSRRAASRSGGVFSRLTKVRCFFSSGVSLLSGSIRMSSSLSRTSSTVTPTQCSG